MKRLQSKPLQKNIRWHAGHLSDRDRAARLRQRGVVIWFTGLSGSGKSTVARELELALVRRGKFAYVLDGDNVRHGLNADLDFSPKDRQENIRRIGEVSKLFCQANVICLTAFISPYRADRQAVRALLKKGEFIEVFCDASLAACEARDVKGLYKKARAGKIKDFTGIFSPYEAPKNPELRLDTGGDETPAQSAQRVLAYLVKRRILAR